MMPLLQRWADVQCHAEATWDQVEDLMGYTDSESPMGKAVWDTFAAYTATLSALIGDTSGWLEWYHLENNMGQKGMTVTLRRGGKPRKISTLRDLARVISTLAAPMP